MTGWEGEEAGNEGRCVLWAPSCRETGGADRGSLGLSLAHSSPLYCLDLGHSYPRPASQVWDPGLPPLIYHPKSVLACLPGLLLKLQVLFQSEDSGRTGVEMPGVGRGDTSPHLNPQRFQCSPGGQAVGIRTEIKFSVGGAGRGGR